MEWNIPSENAIITRLDELYEALDRFPDSPMAPAWQHEIERRITKCACPTGHTRRKDTT